ncbi:NUDIX hydrolase [Burkholderia ubonensis]|uniref:NUDIX hydrolase n=1 Tax=Burkholderia ubonensis TaxID=101571 RepID=UPI0009B46CF7|nr:NUDIX domain-containing protein [Burkholderia ubonensis]
MKQRATIVCRQADQILLVTRSFARWSLPGGKIRRGESPDDAARRELEEETQLVVRDLTWLFEFRGRNTEHQVFDALIARDAVARASQEIMGCQWLDTVQIAKMPTSVATRSIVQLLTTNDHPPHRHVEAFAADRLSDTLAVSHI